MKDVLTICLMAASAACAAPDTKERTNHIKIEGLTRDDKGAKK
jgi:hypothetical protein